MHTLQQRELVTFGLYPDRRYRRPEIELHKSDDHPQQRANQAYLIIFYKI